MVHCTCKLICIEKYNMKRQVLKSCDVVCGVQCNVQYCVIWHNSDQILIFKISPLPCTILSIYEHQPPSGLGHTLE